MQADYAKKLHEYCMINLYNDTKGDIYFFLWKCWQGKSVGFTCNIEHSDSVYWLLYADNWP